MKYYSDGLKYYSDRGETFSPLVAYEKFRLQALAGDIDSKVMAFVLLYEFPNTLAEKANEAIHFLVEAAHSGDKLAQFNFGLILSNGFYVKKNIEAANDWLRLSAGQGERDASVLLGINLVNQYSKKTEVESLDDDRFEYIVSHLRFAEELKHVQGLLVLASFYFLEKRDIEEASRLLRIADGLGEPKALEFLKEFNVQYEKERNYK